MTDRRLQVFYAVAQAGSLTRAARVLHMTQPAVTAQIRQFEAYYGVRLFNRRSDGVSLTEAGRGAYGYAERIMALYGELDSTLRRGQTQTDAHLTLGVTPAAADFVFSALLERFQALLGDVDVEVGVGERDALVVQLAQGAVDMVVLEECRAARRFTLEHCWFDPLDVLVPAAHALAGRRAVTLSALVGLSIVCGDRGGGLRDLLLARATEEALDPSTLQLNDGFGSLEAVLGAVKAGLGIAVVPESAAGSLPRDHGMRRLPLEPTLARRFYLLGTDRRRYSASVRALVEGIRVGDTAGNQGSAE